MAGADGYKIGLRGLQEALDFCRHSDVTIVEHLGHQRLQLRKITYTAGDDFLHRCSIARLPSARQQIEGVGPFLHINQAVQQQTVLDSSDSELSSLSCDAV